MSQRSHQRPQMAPLGQQGQVLANLNPRRFGCDRPELAANIVGCVGLEVETIKLRKTAREKNVDDRPGRRLGPAILAAYAVVRERGNVACGQSEKANASGLEKC